MVELAFIPYESTKANGTVYVRLTNHIFNGIIFEQGNYNALNFLIIMLYFFCNYVPVIITYFYLIIINNYDSKLTIHY